jgi:hypothetical protein
MNNESSGTRSRLIVTIQRVVEEVRLRPTVLDDVLREVTAHLVATELEEFLDR